MALDDPLTEAEKGQIDRNLPVLGKNPPGVDLDAVLNRFRDSIAAEIVAAAGLPFVHEYRAADTVFSSSTFANLGDAALVVPSTGSYLLIFHGDGVLSGSSDFEYGWSIDGADPSSTTRQDFGSINQFAPSIHLRVLSLTEAQTVRAMARRALGSASLTLARQTTLIVRLGD